MPLPDSWKDSKFTDFLDIEGGTQPPKSKFIYEPAPGYIRLLQIRDFGERPVPTFIPFTKTLKTCTQDDILIARYGASIGRIVTGLKGAYNVALTKVVIPESLDRRYVYWYLNSPDFQREITSFQRTAQSGFNKGDLAEIAFPIAPPPEQKRIVAKLDTLFSHLDQLKARLEKIPELVKQFRQGVLTQAITGKLTEEWRRDRKNNPGVDLTQLNELREFLQRENAASRGQKYFKYKQPVDIEIGGRTKGVEYLFEIPASWRWASLDYTVWSVSDGPHFSPNYVSPDEGVPFISARNIGYKGIDFGDAKYVSERDHLEFIKRGKPEIGDVLLTKGGTTGIATVVNAEIEFSVWVHVALLKVVKKFVSPEYLRDVLTSDFLYRQSQAQTHGVGNQDLGLTRMIFMTIPLPPRDEQHEIVRKIAALFAVADRIEILHTAIKEKIETLPQAILSKAFRGELIVQQTEAELKKYKEQLGEIEMAAEPK